MSDPRPLPHLQLADDEIQEDEDHPDSGALLRWEKGDGGPSGHVALLGIRTIILCLVLCMGRVIQDGKSAIVLIIPTYSLGPPSPLVITTDSRPPPLPPSPPQPRAEHPLTLQYSRYQRTHDNTGQIPRCSRQTELPREDQNCRSGRGRRERHDRMEVGSERSGILGKGSSAIHRQCVSVQFPFASTLLSLSFPRVYTRISH
jgi:hypothetical protein